MTTPARAFVIVAVLFAAFVATGWRTVADAERDEKIKWQLRAMDRESFALEQRVNDLDNRVKALEQRR